MKTTLLAGSLVIAALAFAGGCASRGPDANRTNSDVMDLTNTPARMEPSGTPNAQPQMGPPPAPLPPEAPVAVTQQPSAGGAQRHTVAAKDTLYSLAIKYYGDAKQWTRIRDANQGLVPERMPVGKTIVIP